MANHIQNTPACYQEALVTFMQKQAPPENESTVLRTFDKRPFSQDLLLEQVVLLFAAFPDRCPEKFKGVTIKIDGLCKGLSIAFEEAYLKNSLNEHITTQLAISYWDKNPASLSEETVESWFDFINKVFLYQSSSNILKEDFILKIGSTYLYQPIKDKKCLFGTIDFISLEEVLNNPIVADTLKSGMILLYFYSTTDYHAISIRKMKDHWYLYDPNQEALVQYFPDSKALSIHLSQEVTCAPILTFISFEKMLIPNAALSKIANHIDRLYGEGSHAFFIMRDHNPILSYEKVLIPENFDHIIHFGFFEQNSKDQCTLLHMAFAKQAGHLCIPLFKYAGHHFPAALQVPDIHGFTPFMILFLHNPDVADAVLEILYEYPEALLMNLSITNEHRENTLYLASFFRRDIVLGIFEKLPEHRAALIDLMMSPQEFGATALWAFCKRPTAEELKKLESYMLEYFCALPDHNQERID